MPNQNLAHGGAAGNEDGSSSAIDLTHTNFRPAFQSRLSFNTLIDFTCLPLEMDNKVANTMLEANSGLCRDKMFSTTFQQYFFLTSSVSESFSLSTLLVPTSNQAEEQGEEHQLKNLPKDFIEKYHSLEQRLQTNNSEISPKMATTYAKLQVAARMLVVLSFIGPITWTLLVGDKLRAAVVAAVASFTFIAFGMAGKWASFLCLSKKQELKVKEKIIRLMLISVILQKEKLNRISDLVNGGMLVQDDVISKAVDDMHRVIRNERKIILQTLSEQESSPGGVTLEELV